MKIQWNRVTWYSKIAAVIVFLIVFALGFYMGAEYNEVTNQSAAARMGWGITKYYRINPFRTASTTTQKTTVTTPAKTTTTKTTTTTPVQTPVASPATTTVQPAVQTPAVTPPTTTNTTPVQTTPTNTSTTPVAGEVRFNAYITAYTYWDNTPPGSSDISNPIIHSKAGGTGTYTDPITLAVGHSISGGTDTLDYSEGTKFYLPNLRKYFIVEDTCGDGNTPQNGPCHTGYQGHPWLDLWIDGATGSKSSTNTCAENITEIFLVIQNPASNYAVVSGPVYNNGCSAQFGDTVISV